MTAAGMRMMGPNCTCSGCEVFADNFNRPDEDINPNDSTGNWKDEIPPVLLNNRLHIRGNRLLAEFVGASDFPIATYEHAPPSHFSISIDVELYSGGACELRVVTDALKTYGITLYQSAGDPPAACGQIVLVGNVTGAQFSFVPNVAVEVAHRLTLCYDPDTKILSGNVVLHGEAVPHSTHLFEVTMDGTPEKIQIFPTLATGGTFGDQYYDNFAVIETKVQDEYYGSYYYYYYGNHCPCGGPRGCQSVSPVLSIEGLDCRFHVSGDSTPGDGFLTLAAGTAAQWWESWSGIDNHCRPDHTTYLASSVRIKGYGESVAIDVAWLNSTHKLQAKLTAESSDGANDGTLKIYDSGGAELGSVVLAGAIKDTWVQVKVCYDGFNLSASALGEFVEAEAPDTRGQFVGWENLGTSDADVSGITISHNIYSPNCPGCDENITSGCDICEDEIVPARIAAMIEGVLPGHETHCSGATPTGSLGADINCDFCERANGTWILPYGGGSIHGAVPGACGSPLAGFDAIENFDNVSSCSWSQVFGPSVACGLTDGSDEPNVICRGVVSNDSGGLGFACFTAIGVTLYHNSENNRWVVEGVLQSPGNNGDPGLDPGSLVQTWIYWSTELPEGADPINCPGVLDGLELKFAGQCKKCGLSPPGTLTPDALCDGSGSTMRLAVA